MNTNALKRFAPEARIKLIDQIGAKLEKVLTTDSVELREKATAIKQLQEAINLSSKQQLIDAVAYTWFNRMIALRFMDVNGYEPIGVKVISPNENATLPQLLQEAKAGNIPDELPVNKQRVYDLLSGKLPATNAQNEAYRELLVAACNNLHKIFPFLFEKIDDYSELLLPDDLLSEFSIIEDIKNGMPTEDCKEVEILGWLYQFYISEKKDEVFTAKGKVEKEDIPAVTQLFTPRWIVEYMVQNTVGKLWLQNIPNSKLQNYMPYYIASPSDTEDDFLKINSVEEITLLDQACGSGHILVYGFELLSKIYEEEGYDQSEIPKLIIEKNLIGFEIDERAAQLASLALMLKARSYQRRAFRKNITPNIICYKDLALTTDEIKDTFSQVKIELNEELLHDLKNMQQATNLGSLIQTLSSNDDLQKTLIGLQQKENINSDLFLQKNVMMLIEAIKQLIALAQKYHSVVANPPYMGSKNMNKGLSDFVKTNYPDSKADLMACFMEAGLAALKPKGILGMINQHSWMFLSSYEKLREKLIENITFDTLLHLGARTFPEIGGEVVQNASFTFINKTAKNKGSYIRLVDENTSELKNTKTLEAIQNPNCTWFYTANQNNFQKIPGSPIGYWLSEKILKIFEKGKQLDKITKIRQGLASGNNSYFIRYWTEIDHDKFNKSSLSIQDAIQSNSKWFPYNKGGEYRKWSGNKEFVIIFDKMGVDMLSKSGNNLPSKALYFKAALTWTAISGNLSVRVQEKGTIFSNAGMVCIADNEDFYHLLAFFNSKVSKNILQALSPTLNFNAGDIKRLPYIKILLKKIKNKTTDVVKICDSEWNTRETSWDFEENELIRIKGNDLEDAYDAYCNYWQLKFNKLHSNEEELNRQFIEIYGLEEELSPDVPLTEITLLKEEVNEKKLKKVSELYQSGWQLQNSKWILEEANPKPKLPFDTKEIMQQFVSYAVGCMFGRYSLDKKGLILANQGETLQDYLQKIELSKDEVSFLPDDDNVIPILDNEWFEDDIVGRFYKFLKVGFGDSNFEKNLAFVEDGLGKDIRTYFLKDFYEDHIKRYKKRPIYWMFSSPKGEFNAMIYMHRYTQDSLNQILNGYLKSYKDKLTTEIDRQAHIKNVGTAREQTIATKEEDRIRKVLLELQEYEREMYKIATERIEIDLDDGVLVNYNKFGSFIKEVKGLNNKAAKAKVKKFDWIDVSEIR